MISPTGPAFADHPRIRGEHISMSVFEITSPGSSPHTRGALSSEGGGHFRGRIIPAYAGSTDPGLPRRCAGGDHPRIRGEHIYSNLKVPEQAGSSPHTRGALWGAVAEAVADTDHPRIRGEHDFVVAGDSVLRGSSPHTRGAQCAVFHDPRHAGIIPAYAGSTFLAGLRGAGREGSSPHTRGAPQPHQTGNAGRGIIPAYAGSTWTRSR